MFIHCRNSSCKNYFEDSCIKNLNNEMVCFDEDGKCETFEAGEFEGYTESKVKYSTFQAYCNKCGHETEHEQIRDDSSDFIETVTSCLACGDHDVDVDSKEQIEDEQRYFEMAGNYDMPNILEGDDEDARDIESTEQSEG